MSYDNIKIRRIIGNFKIDEEDKVWFMFWSSLRVQTRDDSMLHRYIYTEKMTDSIYETELQMDVILTSSFS